VHEIFLNIHNNRDVNKSSSAFHDVSQDVINALIYICRGYFLYALPNNIESEKLACSIMELCTCLSSPSIEIIVSVARKVSTFQHTSTSETVSSFQVFMILLP
jgi:hypothetical protein